MYMECFLYFPLESITHHHNGMDTQSINPYTYYGPGINCIDSPHSMAGAMNNTLIAPPHTPQPAMPLSHTIHHQLHNGSTEAISPPHRKRLKREPHSGSIDGEEGHHPPDHVPTDAEETHGYFSKPWHQEASEYNKMHYEHL